MGLLLAATLTAQAQHGPESHPDAPPQVAAPTPSGHNPTKALLLSLLPGAGQVYNGQAWKIPIFYAALGTMGYLTYSYYSDMKMFKDEYLRVGQSGTSTLEGYEGLSGYYLYNYYQANNKNFQRFAIITVAVYGLNLLDAYVFGHLYDFNVSEDLTLQVSPSVAPDYGSRLGMAPSLNLSLTF